VFKNTRTGQTTAELPTYPAEDEHSGKMRLTAAGWTFPTDARFDVATKKFVMTPAEEEESSDDGE